MKACSQFKGASEDIQGTIVHKTFVYEKEGCGGEFTIRINDDGTFDYCEGVLSSYIGNGSWRLDNGILVLTDDDGTADPRVNRFEVKESDLVFLSEDSSNFLYVKVADGEHFVSTSDKA